MTGPLAGVHVLDLARVLAGPYAAMLLDAADGPLVIAVGNDDIWRRFAPLAGLDPADVRFSTNAPPTLGEHTDGVRAAMLGSGPADPAPVQADGN
jgi:crotonobetainyl-CoA:carnitine CoA-transferase CaiB-like acyl-CoA transferase